MSVSTLLASLFDYKAWANEELFATLMTLEAEQAPARHAAIRILNHVYVVDCIFAANLLHQTHQHSATNTVATPTLMDLQEAVRVQDRWYIDHVRGLPLDRLDEVVKFTFVDGDRGAMTREEMLAHVVTHGGYHRGAVGRILVDVGIAPPRDVFTGFLHAAEPARRITSE